jgi:hypothetical protein
MNEKLKQSIDEIDNVLNWMNKLPIPTNGCTAKMMRLESAKKLIQEIIDDL